MLHLSKKKDNILIVKSQIDKKLKVFVGLSGGVDSSVSAALLKEDGYDVTGVFIKVWQPDWISCTWKEDRLDAMRVCAKLGIPFITLDLENEYKKEVVDYMIAEYKAGRTPNPDVMCNKYVKFGAFFDFAMKNGADYVATGHYARVETREILNSKLQITNKIQKPKIQSKGNLFENSDIENLLKIENWKLEIAKDLDKDQSYFLWTLTQKQLSKTLFPVGDLIKKTEVRRLAKKFGLITAEKKDSQGLCFIGKIDIKKFLENYIKPKKGKVVNENGEVIGEHNGVLFFTIGERHGFTITRNYAEQTRTNAEKNINIDQKPFYVVAKDLKKNILTVSHKNPEGMLEVASNEAKIENINWTIGIEPDFSKKYQARIRYRQPLQSCKIKKVVSGQCLVVFDKPQNAITPGQSLVIYDEEVCLGGGIIE